MRKIFVLLAIALIFVSCDEKRPHLVTITNSATKAVSYTYNGEENTLAVSGTKNYEIWESYGPPRNVVDNKGIASIVTKQNTMTGDYTFSDADPIDLKVINTLPVDVTIKADNFIDNGNPTNSTELEIPANDKIETAQIYTRNPKFTSTTNYPIIVGYLIEKIDEDENVMSVIIR